MGRICALIEEKKGIAYHRIEIPMAKLHDECGLDICVVNGFTLNHPPNYDAIILNRVSRQAEPYIFEAKKQGTKIILDLDDWIYLPEWHGMNDGFVQPEIYKKILQTLSIADVVWTPSKTLATEISKIYKGEIIYIPNAIDFEQPQFKPQPRQRELLTFGWVGAASHNKDIELLADGLSRLTKRKDYKIFLGGYSKSSPEYWNYICYLMSTDGTLKNRFDICEATDVYNYGFMYNLMDIALAPLSNDLYSRCKSNLKILEAAAFGLPVIASNTDPYKEFITKGLIFEGKDWYKRMNWILDNRRQALSMGAALQEYVKENYNINKINELRYHSLNSLN